MIQLSAIQHDLLLAEQLNGSEINTIGGYLIITNAIDIIQFQQARQQLIEHYDAFHLVIDSSSHPPTQSLTHNLPELVVSEWSSAEEAVATQWMQTDFLQPFIHGNVLFRDALLCVGKHKYYYYAKAHHLIMDGYGFALWGRKLIRYYQGVVEEHPPTFLSQLKIEQQYLTTPQYQRDHTFWHKQLAQRPSALFTSSTTQLQPSRRFSWSIEATLYQQLLAYTQQQKSGVLALFMLLIGQSMQRTKNTEGVVFGYPVHNRRNAVMKQIIGLLMNVNLLPLQLKMSGSVAEGLQQINQQLKQQYRYQRYPIAHLTRDLGLAEQRQALFDISFNYQTLDLQIMLDDVPVLAEYLDNQQAQTPLAFTLCAYHPSQGVVLHIDWQEEYFSKSEIVRLQQRLAEQLVYCLQHKPSDIQLFDLPLFLADETRFWAGTTLALQQNTVFDQFIIQAQRFPENIAFIEQEKSISYGDLNQQVTRLAQSLLIQNTSLITQPQQVIAIYGDYGLPWLTSLLAVWKIGAIALSLECHLPQELLITRARFAHSLLVINTTKEVLIAWDLSWFGYEQLLAETASITHEKISVNPNDHAYIIYTSGSTGTPKAIISSHVALVNRLAHFQVYYPLVQGQRCVQKTAISFIDALTENLTPLTQGATIIRSPSGYLRQPEVLLNWLAQEQIIRIICVPSLLKAVIQSCKQSPKLGRNLLPGMQWISSGEVLEDTLIEAFYACLPKSQLFNLYGASEVAGDVLMTSLSPKQKSYLGFPMANMTAYVINAYGEALPQGNAGELVIQGPSVATEYLQQKELTQEKFSLATLMHSFDTKDKVFRTGDIVRYEAEGFVYIGRVDREIQHLGHRIALEQIEQLVNSLPSVKQSCVLYLDNHLVAFVEITTESFLPAWQEPLYQFLPDYAIPQHWQKIDSWPYTASGKLDRQQLSEHFIVPSSYASPRNIKETKYCELWQKNLAVSVVGIDDNYFALGGNSITATHLLHQLQKQGFNHQLSDLFYAPTIAQLVTRESNKITDFSEKNIKLDTTQTRLEASIAQQGLWFIQQLAPKNSQYHLYADYRLLGDLNQDKLIHCWQTLLLRHSILTTTYEFINGKLFSFLQTAWKLPFFSTSVSPTEIDNKIIEFQEQPFDLTKDLPIRFGLFRLQSTTSIVEEWRLVIVIHHIAADAWSVGILLTELNQLYRGEVLKPLVHQYQEIIHHQQQSAYQDYLHTLLPKAQQALSSISEHHGFAIDHVDERHTLGDTERVTLELSRELSQQIQAFCQQQQITPFMYWFATLNILLQRFFDQPHVTIATATSGREQHSWQDIVGYFVNLLPINLPVKSTLCVQDYFNEVRVCIQQAQARREVPFSWLLNQQEPPTAEQHPIAQVALLLHNIHDQTLDLLDLETQSMPITNECSPFDLLLHVIPQRNGSLLLSWQYRSQLWQKQTVMALAKSSQYLLSQWFISPERLLWQLALVPPQSITSPPLLSSLLTCHLLEGMYQQKSKAIALISATGKQYCYAELLVASRQYATFLQQQGVVSGSRVLLYLPKSEYWLISMLAIIHLGAVYIPLALEQATQITPLITQLQPELLLHSAQNMPVIHSAIHMIAIDDPNIQQQINNANKVLSLQGDYDSIAYIMLTSGTTTTPKAVMIQQQNIARLAYSAGLPVDSKTRTLQYANLSFDAATFEIWCTWLQGGTLILPNKDTLTISNLHHYIMQQQVNTLWLTAALLPSFVQRLSGNSPLRYILTGGDVVSPQAVAVAYERHAELTLINGYGPTENTTFSSCYVIPRTHNPQYALPIGSGLPCDELFVLDDFWQQQPIGAVGQLAVSGQGLAVGYEQQGELTAQQFIPHPYPTTSGQRLYLTGDRVRYLPDGELAYLGRNDQQVKVRGFRVQLTAIQYALEQLAQIDQAEIIYEQQLVAYVASKQPLNYEQLTTQLAQYLPHYAIPQQIKQVQIIPITANGKLDWPTLIAHAKTLTPQNLATELAQDPAQQVLQQSWQQVLGLSQPPRIDSHFFQLGGDSIQALQVIDDLQQQHWQLTLSELYQALPLHQIAAFMQPGRQTIKVSQGEQPLTPIQYWFFEQEIDHTRFNQGILLAVPEFTQSFLQHWLQRLYRRQDVLRLSFIERQAHYQAINTAIIEQTLVVVNDEQAFTLDDYDSIDIEQGPLLRVFWFPKQQQLGVLAHHLIMDAVSWHILNYDLLQSWQEYQTHQCLTYIDEESRSQLPEFTTWLLTKDFNQSVEFWQQQLIDFQWSITKSSPQHHQFHLSIEQSQLLLELACELFHGQAQELLITLCLLSLPEDLAHYHIWLESHGREETVNLSQTMGWLTALYPLAFHRGTFDETLQQVKQQRRHLPHGGVSYGALRYLSTEYQDQLTSTSPKISINYLSEIDTTSWPVLDLYWGRSATHQAIHWADLSIEIWQQQQQLFFSIHGPTHITSAFHQVFTTVLEQLLHRCQVLDLQKTPTAASDSVEEFEL